MTWAWGRGSANQWEKPRWKSPAWVQGHHSPPSLLASAFQHPPTQSQAGSMSVGKIPGAASVTALSKAPCPASTPHLPQFSCGWASLTCRVEVLITAHLPFLWESRSILAPSSS